MANAPPEEAPVVEAKQSEISRAENSTGTGLVSVDSQPGAPEEAAEKPLTWPQFLRRERQTFILSVSLVSYFLICIIVFGNLEDWTVMECIYFSVVLVTTVGYGDYLPTHDASKIAVCILSFFALSIVVIAIDSVLKALEKEATSTFMREDSALGIFDEKAAQKKRVKKFLWSFGVFALVILIGTLVFGSQVEDFQDEGDGNKWVNGFYLTVITVTTIGFGDYSPAGSNSLQGFGILLMILGIPAAATAIGMFSGMVFGESQEETSLRMVKGRMTKAKFAGLLEFVKNMREQGVGGYRGQAEDQISRFEYLAFMLVKNGVVNLKNVQEVMQNFDEHDRSGTGFIGVEDIMRAKQMHEPAGKAALALGRAEMAMEGTGMNQGLAAVEKEAILVEKEAVVVEKEVIAAVENEVYVKKDIEKTTVGLESI